MLNSSSVCWTATIKPHFNSQGWPPPSLFLNHPPSVPSCIICLGPPSPTRIRHSSSQSNTSNQTELNPRSFQPSTLCSATARKQLFRNRNKARELCSLWYSLQVISSLRKYFLISRSRLFPQDYVHPMLGVPSQPTGKAWIFNLSTLKLCRIGQIICQ